MQAIHVHFWGIGKRWSPRQDSNLNRPLRRRVHYPLCYREGARPVRAQRSRGAMVTAPGQAGPGGPQKLPTRSSQ